jgi:hypothetical protein
LLVSDLSSGELVSGRAGHSFPDPLAVLKQQSEAARALHNAVVEAQGAAYRL